VRRLGQHRQRRVLGHGDGSGERLTRHVNRYVHGDLLALADDQQVNVSDGALHGVALNVFDEHHLLVAVPLDVHEGVGVLEGHHGLVAGQ